MIETPEKPGKAPLPLRNKLNRLAKAVAYSAFALTIALIFVQDAQPQAAVKETASHAPRQPADASIHIAAMPGAGVRSLRSDGNSHNAGPVEGDDDVHLAARSRRSRSEPQQEPPVTLPTPQRSAVEQARADQLMARLVSAYPDFLTRHDANNLTWRDGTTMGFDDGQEKSFEQRLERPDIEDQFAIPYPLGEMLSNPEPDFDPGRFRNEAFFTRMYGDCRRDKDMPKRLVDVVWLPNNGARKIKVTPVNGVAGKLQQVSNELDALPADLLKYLRPISVTFNCHDITNTGRGSAHGYGIAIDINTAQGDYWENRARGRGPTLEYRNRIPQAIVAIFEKHGFIWGGKWYHYDTAHFEYRPELLIADEVATGGDFAVPMPEKQPRNLN